MCVTSLLGGPWADLCPFYGLYCKRSSLYIKVYGKPLYREKTVFIKTHKTFIFVGYGNDCFFPIQILLFRMFRNNADIRQCSYFELGLPVLKKIVSNE